MAISLLPGQEKTKDKYLWDCHANVTALPEDSYVSPCEFTSGAYWAPGILMTLGVVMLNVIRWTALGDDMSLGDDSSATKAKIWVVVCFVIMFCALGGGVWITVVVRVPPSEGAGLRGWVAVGRARVCVDPWRCHTAATAAGPRAAHAHNYAAHSYRAPRCRRTGNGRRTTRCGWAPGSPCSCSASACSWEASSSASPGAKRTTPSDCHLKWSSPSECGGCGGCRLSLGRGRGLRCSHVSESYGGTDHGGASCEIPLPNCVTSRFYAKSNFEFCESTSPPAPSAVAPHRRVHERDARDARRKTADRECRNRQGHAGRDD